MKILKDPLEIAPHRLLPVALKAVEEVVRARLQLFVSKLG